MWHKLAHTFEVLLFVIVVSILNTPRGIAQPLAQTKQQCGQQKADIPLTGYFWKQSTSETASGKVSSLVIDDRKAPAKSIVTDGKLTAFGHKVMKNGSAVAFLTSTGSVIPYDLNTPVTLNIVTRDGTTLKLPGDSNWWQLGPELKPGHFGIVAYDDKFFASILDVSWSNGTIIIQPLEQLPFRVRPYGAAWEKFINISPKWEYLAYTEGSEFKIYSRTDQQVVWRMTYTKGIPRVSWVQDEGLIGIVNVTGTGGDGKLIAVDKKGIATTIADLATQFGEDVLVVGTTSTSANGQLAFLLQTKQGPDSKSGNAPRNQKYVLLHLATSQFIDLCYSSGNDDTGPLVWVDHGNYLMFAEFGKGSTLKSKIVIISTKTGDYLYLEQPETTQLIDWTEN